MCCMTCRTDARMRESHRLYGQVLLLRRLEPECWRKAPRSGSRTEPRLSDDDRASHCLLKRVSPCTSGYEVAILVARKELAAAMTLTQLCDQNHKSRTLTWTK